VRVVLTAETPNEKTAAAAGLQVQLFIKLFIRLDGLWARIAIANPSAMGCAVHILMGLTHATDGLV
jgi:hypothetical protein